MTSKTELKSFFQTGDKPEQDHFYEWMDSYWHKEDPEDIIPANRVDIDLSGKAEKTAENLTSENIASWKSKLIEPSQITIETTSGITTDYTANGNKMHGKNVIIKNGASNIDLKCVASSPADFICTVTKAGTGAITIKNDTGVTISQVDYTNVLNGGVGSTARIQRIEGVFYIRIFNT
ncbi:hypothetical protein [Epilithonimonas sp.]|uniref:hypothetical protein n=1 Tax=Epilithonimonas sp. TaxID=2894511 RepID=UPI0035AEDE99